MWAVPQRYWSKASPLQSSYTSLISQCPVAEHQQHTLAQGFLQMPQGFIQSTVPDRSWGEDKATSFSLQVPYGLLLYSFLLFVLKGWKTNCSSSGLGEENSHGDSKGKNLQVRLGLERAFHQPRLTSSADLYLFEFGIQLGKRSRWSFSHGWGF